MKTTFALVAWMAAAVAYAGQVEVFDSVDELDGAREVGIAMQCDEGSSVAVGVMHLSGDRCMLIVNDMGLRVWFPDRLTAGPIKAAKYRGNKMEKARSVSMTIHKKSLTVQVSLKEAVEILRSDKLLLAVDGERFTCKIGEYRADADKAIKLIEAAARGK